MAQESWNEETGIWYYSTIIDVTVSIFNTPECWKIADEFARLDTLHTDMNLVTGGWNDCRILPRKLRIILQNSIRIMKTLGYIRH